MPNLCLCVRAKIWKSFWPNRPPFELFGQNAILCQDQFPARKNKVENYATDTFRDDVEFIILWVTFSLSCAIDRCTLLLTERAKFWSPFRLANPSSFTITCLQSIKLFGLPVSGRPLFTNPPHYSTPSKKRNLIKNENLVTPASPLQERENFSCLFLLCSSKFSSTSVASKKRKVSSCKRGTGFPRR